MKFSADVFFGSLSHDTRLRCLALLLREEELCVCELTHAIGASQPHMSRHLGLLKAADLVVDRREGQWIYYRINPDLPEWMWRVLRETGAGIHEREPFLDDAKALETMPNRPGSVMCA
jgi:ArsR family transcriptional regulator